VSTHGLPDLGIEREKIGTMKIPAKIKVVLDIIMTVMLMVQMAYHIAGDRVHMFMGAILLLLFIIHNILNRNWYKALFKGKYGTARIIYTTINLLLALSMLGMMVSGILLSPISNFLPFSGAMFGRRLHMVSTSWGFILVSAHLGLHWGRVIGKVKQLTVARITHGSIPPLIPRIAVRLGAFCIAAYGVYAFIVRQFGQKMFLLIEFAFFDYEEPAIFFFRDYIAVMGLYTGLSYYVVKFAQRKGGMNLT
jgi:hypothetical protein